MMLTPLSLSPVLGIIPAMPTEISLQNAEASGYSLRNAKRSLAGFAPLATPALWEQQTTDPVIFSVELLDKGSAWLVGGMILLGAGFLMRALLAKKTPYHGPVMPGPEILRTGTQELVTDHLEVIEPPKENSSSRYPKIPGYTLLKRLGAGGMGQVFLAAKDDLWGSKFAVKVLTEGSMTDEAAHARFRREAETMRQLNHPNIVKIFNYGLVNGQPFMVLEYIEGGNLWDWMQRNPPTPENTRRLEKTAAKIMTLCLEALYAIGEAGLLHRDIKPANIFLERGIIPKLGDFGLARYTQQGQTVTATGIVMGTISFLAPEQFRQKTMKTVDIRADIYALGVTLFQMLTGRLPFEKGADEEDVAHLARIMTEPAPDPRDFNPVLSEEMARAILKALEKDRDQRFQTPAEFREALQQLIETP